MNVAFLDELAQAPVEPLGQRLRVGTRIAGIEPATLAGLLLERQLLGAAVPVVDLALEPRLHLALDPVDLRKPTLARLLKVLRHKVRDGKVHRHLLDVALEPVSFEQLVCGFGLVGLEWTKVEIGRRSCILRRCRARRA